MVEMVIVIAVLLLLIFYIVAAVEFSKLTVLKGYPEKKTTALLFCLIVPFAGYLFVCALPNNGYKEMVSNATEKEDSLPEL